MLLLSLQHLQHGLPPEAREGAQIEPSLERTWGDVAIGVGFGGLDHFLFFKASVFICERAFQGEGG